MRLSETVRGQRWRMPLAVVIACAAAWGQSKQIDTAHSTITVHVFKAGVLSALGHDHDAAARRVELRVNASALRVADVKASDKDRAEIQANMVGPEVLDAQNFKEIG